MDFRFFVPQGLTATSENRLPHWEQRRALYFVTFRLADALPARMLRGWRQERDVWLSYHPKPWSPETEREYHQRFSADIERWLDEAHGECLLRDPQVAAAVGDALQHFDGERHDNLSWVVMPNHVHILCSIRAPWALGKVIQSWKGFTGRMVNKMLNRTGEFWQKDYFDRMVRDEEHFVRVVRYIRANPEKAKLNLGEYLYWERDELREMR